MSIMDTTHGAGSRLNNNGNDGFAQIEEDKDGNVLVTVSGNPSAIKRLTIVVNGRERKWW